MGQPIVLIFRLKVREGTAGSGVPVSIKSPMGGFDRFGTV